MTISNRKKVNLLLLFSRRKLELEAVRDIVKYRDKRYRDLLTGSVCYIIMIDID